jgi:hypothetical protein
MARPFSKINPIKKTFYIEKRCLELLAELSRMDKRSPSQYLENLIEADWSKKRKPKTKS